MTKQEFIEYIKQLQNIYTDKKLSKEEIDIWYDNLSFLTVERFNYILSEIYKNNKFMPKLAEILEIHNSIPYEEKQEEIKQHCNKCNDIGYVIYTKIFEGISYKYGAVCSCKRKQRYDGSQLKDLKNKSNYYIPTAEEINLKIEDTKPTKEQLAESMNKLKNSSIIPENIKNILRKKYVNM